ncbi:MAG: CdaR family protein [Clostridia bacterium]|nr:CdaR family protein [[Bacteroides] pectinophilus]MDD5872431.1 CdaR family protein [Clostridia bacterium]
MKEKLLNNLSLKILSAVCAIIIWIIIVNVYDPSTSVTVSGVEVQLVNTESLTEKEYAYEVVDGSKISVYISGPRSIVTDIKAKDIVATADLSNVTVFSDYVDIDVKVVKDGVSASSIEIAPKTTAIRLKIENRVTKTFNIDTELVGTPADGYVIGGQQISPSSVKVTGTSSVVDSISSVKASYDVSGATMNISDVAPIKLYDSQGTEIVDDRIELSKTAVDIKVNVLMTKTVPVTYKTKGIPADGYRVSGIDQAVTEAVIAGTEDVLRDVNSIDVPDSAIDVSGLNADKIFHVRLSSYLPGNVTVMSEGVVNVTVRIYPVSEREISVPVTGIVLSNLPQGYNISFGDVTAVNITVTGEQSVLSALTVTGIVPTIDLSGIKEGDNTLQLKVTLPTNCTLKQNYTVNVTAESVNG